MAFFHFFPGLVFFDMAHYSEIKVNLDLARFLGTIIAVENRKFIKSDTPGSILGRGLISEHPDQLECHRVRASLALGE